MQIEIVPQVFLKLSVIACFMEIISEFLESFNVTWWANRQPERFNRRTAEFRAGWKELGWRFESEWEKDGLMRICEGWWVWSRRFCTCMASGRPCHGMMEELVHRLTSDVQIRTIAACCGLHEQVTPLLHDIRRPGIVIVRCLWKIAKNYYYLRRLCVYVFVRLSVSVCLSAWNFSVLTGRNLMKFDNWVLFKT